MKRWSASSSGYLPVALHPNGDATVASHSNRPALLRIFGYPTLAILSLVSVLSLFAIRHRDEASGLADSLWRTCDKDEPDRVMGYADPLALRPILEHDSRTWIAPTPDLPLEASLEERITAWDSTPVSTASEWISFNMQVCPNSRTYENKLWGFVSAQEDDFKSWEALWTNPKEVRAMRDDMFNFLRGVRDRGLFGPEHHGTGYGIVMSAGNADTFSRSLVTVRLLRQHLNSSIPVEIFHFPGETPDAAITEELLSLNAIVREAPELAKDLHRQKNWHIKATAMIASSFRHVLYLDSDNMPAFAPDDPEEGVLFAPGYERLGAMFWPDYWKTVGQSPVWQIIGVQCRDEWEQEAGTIIIDKSKHLDALHLTDYMLRKYETWFHISDGDKDLFRFAFLALRKRWAIPGRHVAAASWRDGPADAFCGHTMLQHDHMGRPSFVHANMLKKIDVFDFEADAAEGKVWGMSATTPVSANGGDLECDQIANPDLRGRAIKDGNPSVRARAALERGLRVWFYDVGQWPSCLNVRWDDPRTDDEANLSAYMQGLRNVEKAPQHFIGAEGDWRSPLMKLSWAEDVRLRDFEAAFWRAGGHPTGLGF